jgi:hypothetical protein
LLQNFRMRRVFLHHAFICIARADKLSKHEYDKTRKGALTYITLLFIHMPNLEKDIRIGQRTRWVAQYALEAAKTFVILSLLFVNYAKTEENFVRFVKI